MNRGPEIARRLPHISFRRLELPRVNKDTVARVGAASIIAGGLVTEGTGIARAINISDTASNAAIYHHVDSTPVEQALHNLGFNFRGELHAFRQEEQDGEQVIYGSTDQEEDVSSDTSSVVDIVPVVSIPTPQAEATPIVPGAIIAQDDFSDASKGLLPSITIEPNRSSVGYIDGEYEIRNGDTEGRLVGVNLAGSYSDTTLAFDARLLQGPTSSGIVAICRSGSSRGYRLAIYGNGRFRAQRLGEGNNDPILAESESQAIRRGNGVNRIELTCAGNRISAAVNGVELFAVQDGSYARGNLRVGVLGSGAVGRFDNLAVTQR